MNKKRDIIIFVVMAATCFIFFRSLKDADASSKESAKVIDAIAKIVKSVYSKAPESFSDMITVVVRKAAHVIEYTIQSCILCALFNTFEGKIKKHIPWVLFLGLFTACFDEAIQLSMKGRGSLVSDIFVDFSGTLLGLLLCLAALSIRRYIKRKN